MNKKMLDYAVYEEYEEISVALFMECYSATLLEDIRAELDEAENADIVFPEDLDARCRILLRKAERRCKRREFFGVAKKFLHYAAIFAAVILCLSSLLFTTVEAFRESVMKYYIEQTGGHWEIGSITSNNQNPKGTGFNHTDPLAGLLPEGYALTFSKSESLTKFTAIYQNSDGKKIHFSGVPGTNFSTIDAENAQVSREFTLGKHRSIYVEKGTLIHVAWVDESRETVFILFAANLPEDEILGIAEKFVENF